MTQLPKPGASPRRCSSIHLRLGTSAPWICHQAHKSQGGGVYSSRGLCVNLPPLGHRKGNGIKLAGCWDTQLERGGCRWRDLQNKPPPHPSAEPSQTAGSEPVLPSPSVCTAAPMGGRDTPTPS